MNLSHFHCQTSIFPNALKANHSSSGTSLRVTCYFRCKTSVTTTGQAIPARDRVIDFGKYNGKMLGTLPPSYFRCKTSVATTGQAIPARDIVIDFGKYKGKMLGTLPSSYLKWVSKNLRARDFEEWAKLADQVLRDPIYKDRIEWEFAENVLNGNKLRILSSTRDAETSSAVSELLEVSERFGWDNKDKVGWSKINFELLGTSNGGRIPRLESIEKETNMETIIKQKNGHLEVLSEGGARRRERREKQKMRKQAKVQTRAVFGESELGLKQKSRGSFVNDPDADDNKAVYQSEKDIVDDKNLSGQNGNPFPGRESLLRKAFNLRRTVS